MAWPAHVDEATFELLRELHEGTEAKVGQEFFDALVEQVARVLGTKCAWVTQWHASSRRLRALSFVVDGRHVSDYEYAVENTPCEPVVRDGELCHIPDRVLELFPHDPDLAPLGAVSYAGIPLFDVDGALLGHLAVLHDQPLPHDGRREIAFRMFASRAAGELRRVLRDRAIATWERKLHRLFDSTMDAIVELSDELVVLGANEAARAAFGAELAAPPCGFDRFLTSESRGKLRYLADELARRPESRQSLPIPHGFECTRSDGEPFFAEGTLSRLAVDDETLLMLILRDVGERLATERRIAALMQEREYLQSELEREQGFTEILGNSPPLRAVLADVARVAETDATVLITGETGTGKELVARAVHERSARAARRLVRINCAAIPSTLQESEFFGHEKGAFTGATARREGRFKLADGGTLFLDEVGELPLDLQAKLLRVLQEGEYEPVGSAHTERIDVRVVAATNRDLESMVAEGTFRRDLLYRLNVFPIHLPPLRERRGDVLLLAERFVEQLGQKMGRPGLRLTEADKVRLRRYDWPGNVRELHNVIERAAITAIDECRLDFERALPAVGSSRTRAPEIDAQSEDVLTAAELRELERRNIERALALAQGKISGPGGAAERLGLNPNTLVSRMKALGLRRR